MSLKQKGGEKSIKANLLFYSIKSAMAVIFPLVSYPYASRILDVEGIGKVQYCNSVISYFALFAALGIGTYAVREGVGVRNDRKRFSRFSKEIFTINLLSTAIVYVVLLAMLGFHIFAGYETIMAVCSLSILCTTLSVEWVYQIEEDYVYISIRTIFVQLAALMFLFVFVREKGDLIPYSLVLTFASGGYCLYNLFHARKYVDFREKSKLRLRRHFKGILAIFAVNVASSIYLNVDVVMIGLFYGDYQVGLYSTAVKIVVILRGIINSVSTVFMPRLSYYHEIGEEKKYIALLKKGVQISLMFSIPCMIGLIGLGKNIILLFSGKNFLGAVTACQILAVNLVFSTLDNLMYCQILIPHHREKQGCIGTIIGAVSNLILNAILIPRFLIEGAAVATLLAECIVFLYFLYQAKDILSFRELFGGTQKLAFGSAAVVLVVLVHKLLIQNMVLQTVSCVVFSVLAYFGVLLLVRYELVETEAKFWLEKLKIREQK